MIESSKEGQWIRTDEMFEAVCALEMVSELLYKIPDNIYYWKWAIVALHNSLQGFMVLSLQGSNGLNTLTDECAKQWLLAYEQKSGQYPERKLENFLGLYKRIKSREMLISTLSERFRPTGNQTISVKKLNELRNEFIHYVPKNWSLEISGLPEIFLDCLNIIEFLAFKCGNVAWFDNPLEQHTRDLIADIRSRIAKIQITGS
jgi:hypothetical protein